MSGTQTTVSTNLLLVKVTVKTIFQIIGFLRRLSGLFFPNNILKPVSANRLPAGETIPYQTAWTRYRSRQP